MSRFRCLTCRCAPVSYGSWPRSGIIGDWPSRSLRMTCLSPGSWPTASSSCTWERSSRRVPLTKSSPIHHIHTLSRSSTYCPASNRARDVNEGCYRASRRILCAFHPVVGSSRAVATRRIYAQKRSPSWRLSTEPLPVISPLAITGDPSLHDSRLPPGRACYRRRTARSSGILGYDRTGRAFGNGKARGLGDASRRARGRAGDR